VSTCDLQGSIYLIINWAQKVIFCKYRLPQAKLLHATAKFKQLEKRSRDVQLLFVLLSRNHRAKWTGWKNILG